MLSHSNHIACCVGKTESKGSFDFAGWFPALCIGSWVCVRMYDTQIHVQNQVRKDEIKIPAQHSTAQYIVCVCVHRYTDTYTRDIDINRRSKQNGIWTHIRTTRENFVCSCLTHWNVSESKENYGLRSTEGDRELDPKVHTLTQMNKSEQWETQHRCNKERRADNIFLAPSYF